MQLITLANVLDGDFTDAEAVARIEKWCEQHIKDNPKRHAFALDCISEQTNNPDAVSVLDIVAEMHLSHVCFDEFGDFVGYLITDGSASDDEDFRF